MKKKLLLASVILIGVSLFFLVLGFLLGGIDTIDLWFLGK